MVKWFSSCTAATTSTWNNGPPSAPATFSARSTTGPFPWSGRGIEYAGLRATSDRYPAPPPGLSVEPRRAPHRSRFRPRSPRRHSPSEPLPPHLRAPLSRRLLEENPPRTRRLDGIRSERHTDPDSVHDLRVAIRRLSRCLRTFAPLYPDGYWKKIRRELGVLMESDRSATPIPIPSTISASPFAV